MGIAPSEIKKAILKNDEFIISRSVLEQLIKYIPTEEEVTFFFINEINNKIKSN